MLKSSLIENIASRLTQLPVHEIGIHVNTILDTMAKTLVNNGRIEIRGFGTFCLHYRAPGKARNPKTGKRVATIGRYRPHFKAGKELRERVNTSSSPE